MPADPGNLRALSTDGKRSLLPRQRSGRGAQARPPVAGDRAQAGRASRDRVRRRGRLRAVRGRQEPLRAEERTRIYVFDAGARPPTSSTSEAAASRLTFTCRSRATSGARCSPRPGGWSATTSTTAACTASTGRRCARSISPLVDRVTDARASCPTCSRRWSASCRRCTSSCYGGDLRRRAPIRSSRRALGARARARRGAAGGFRVDHVFRTDPDEPDELSPLAQPDVGVRDGDLVLADQRRAAQLGRRRGACCAARRASRCCSQVQRRRRGAPRDVIVQPVAPWRGDRPALRPSGSTRDALRADRQSGRRTIGYVHLRAHGRRATWRSGSASYFPVFDRDGLIIDVRGQPRRQHRPVDPRQAAARGRGSGGSRAWDTPFCEHAVRIPRQDRGDLSTSTTISDGEAFAEGFRRLGLGKVIGTRTWGGEIWLSPGQLPGRPRHRDRRRDRRLRPRVATG